MASTIQTPGAPAFNKKPSMSANTTMKGTKPSTMGKTKPKMSGMKSGMCK